MFIQTVLISLPLSIFSPLLSFVSAIDLQCDPPLPLQLIEPQETLLA